MKRCLFTILIVTILVFISFVTAPTSAEGSVTVLGEDSLPLDVYILSLPEVGSYRASNHSKVVEGAIEATRTRMFGVFLDWSTILHVNVSITAHVISDWEAYRMLIEWGNNTIVINTHDEYLPVPSGYAKEEWVDKIADFMLNRWGTWAHSGGYPLFRLWYQNGTKEEWGEDGFKTLMSHIGRGNMTCYPPADLESGQKPTAIFEGDYLIYWYFHGPSSHTAPIGSFAEANVGYPIDYYGFEGQTIYTLYALRAGYLTGCTVHFSSNQTTFNFGIYVHQSAWRFFDGGGREWSSELEDLAMGFITTAAAIYGDIGDAAYQVYGTYSANTFSASTPRDRIKVAKMEGRTVGLDQAEELLQKAVEEYNAHNYKLAITYSKQAKTAADNATQPNPWPQIVGGITMATVAVVVGAYYRSQNKKKDKRNVERAQQKQR